MCDADGESSPPPPRRPPLSRAQSIVDELLDEINVGLHRQRPARRFSADSDACATDCSVLSAASIRAEVRRYSKQQLAAKDESELRRIAKHLHEVIVKLNSTLVTLLRQRDRQLTRRGHHYDLVTAVLQAVSLKRRVDTRMRFSLEPGRGESGFAQWMDATKIVVRLPDGIPAEFRKKIWLTLAERYLASRDLDWEATARFCFNERCNPDDDNLGVQIVKDLHRTGCSLFSGEQAEQNQALLKRVLLAYARWNKSVGYCQGFNLLAAFVLEVVEWCDQDALKMMIYLVEGVLPEGYFANNLRGLSVDMAVFRELLRLRHSNLATHLDRLQAGESKAGLNYEPPLTNVFTMQWFLTLFTTCLPRSLVVRVWDLILLEGNEVLLRTAITIWEGLADRIMTVGSADEFYSVMGVLTREMVEFGVKDPHEFIVAICDVSRVPIPQLSELRDRYTYNIRPLPPATAPSRHGLWLFLGDDEDNDADSDHQMMVAAAFCGISNAFLVAKNRGQGAVHASLPSPLDPSRMTLDISTLKRQYSRLRQRQRQAHIILTSSLQAPASTRPQRLSTGVPVNNLLAGQKPIVRRARPPPPTHAVPSGLPVSYTATLASGVTSTTRVSPRVAVPVSTTSSTSPSSSPVANARSASAAATSKAARKASPRVTTRDPIPVETLSWEQAKKLKAGRDDSSSSSSSSSTELCDDKNNRSSSPDEAPPARKESTEKQVNDADSKVPLSLPEKKPPRRLKNGTYDKSSDSSLSSSSSSEEDECRDRRAKRRHDGHDAEGAQPKPPRRLAEGSKPAAATATRKSGARAALVRHREPITLDDDDDGSYKPDDESDGSRNSSSDSLSSEEEGEEEQPSSKLETVSSLAEVSSAIDDSSRSLEGEHPQKQAPDSLSSETESSRNTFSNMVLSGSDKYNIRTSSEASSWKSSSDACLTTSSSSGPPPPSEDGSRKPSDERANNCKISDEEFQRLSRKFSQSALSDRQAQRMALRNTSRRGTDELGAQRLSPNIDRSSSEDVDRKLSLGSPPRWPPKRTNTSDETSGDSPSTELDRFRRDSSKRGSASSEVSVSARELRKWSYYKYDSRNTSNDVSWRSSDTDYQQSSLRYERSISEEADDGDAAAGEGIPPRPRLLRDDRTCSFRASQESIDSRLLPYDSSSSRESIFPGEKRRGSSLTCNTLTTLNEMTFEKADEDLSQEASQEASQEVSQDNVKYSESSTSSSHLMSPNKELRRSAFLLGQKVSPDSGVHTVADSESKVAIDEASGDHDSAQAPSGYPRISPEGAPRKSSLKFDASKFFESLAHATSATRGARCASEGSATALGAHSGEESARPKTARSLSTDATMMTSGQSCGSGVVGGDGTTTSLPSIRRQRFLSGDVGDTRVTPPTSPRRSLGENYNPFPTRRPSFTGCISDFKVKLGLYSSQDKPAMAPASNGCKTTSVKR